MPKTGSRNLNRKKVNSLLRTSKRKVRQQKSSTPEYSDLVSNFTKDEWLDFFNLYRKYGTPGRKANILLEKATQLNVDGRILELIELRTRDLKVFNKVKQQIEYRWSDRQQFIKEKNYSEDNRWMQIAKGIQSRSDLRTVDKRWLDQDTGLKNLIKHLKNLWDKQEGKCAITGIPMTLIPKDENTASPDRIKNSSGYIRGNIHLTCWWVNRMKFDLTASDFEKKINILYKSFAK